jgi:hypothetical protein
MDDGNSRQQCRGQKRPWSRNRWPSRKRDPVKKAAPSEGESTQRKTQVTISDETLQLNLEMTTDRQALVAAAGNSKEPLIKVRIGKETYLALLDSGAVVSFVSDKVAERLEATGVKRNLTSEQLGLLRGSADTEGQIMVSFQWNGGRRYQKFRVVKGMTRHVILGRNFLNATRININIHAGAILLEKDRKVLCLSRKWSRSYLIVEQSARLAMNGQKRCVASQK